MKNFFILILLSISFSMFSQNNDEIDKVKQEDVKLEEVKYDKKNESFLIIVKDKVTYDLLKDWKDEMITSKYTGVEGILAYGLNRKKEDIIEAEISEKNAAFLLKMYAKLKEEDIREIISKKKD